MSIPQYPATLSEVVMASGRLGPMTTVNVSDTEDAGVAESDNPIPKVNEPSCVGTPCSSPDDSNVNPLGIAPDITDQVYGGTPPLASNSASYFSPRFPEERLVVEIARLGAGVTTSVTATVATSGIGLAESVAPTTERERPCRRRLTVEVAVGVHFEARRKCPGHDRQGVRADAPAHGKGFRVIVPLTLSRGRGVGAVTDRGAAGATTIVNVPFADAGFGVAESVAWAVNDRSPPRAGCPSSCPMRRTRARPAATRT